MVPGTVLRALSFLALSSGTSNLGVSHSLDPMGNHEISARPRVRKMIVLLLMVGIAFDARAPSAAEQDRPFIVFAAASLTEAVTEVSAAFTQETGIAVKTSFAASSLLARQIEAGAPATVFFAADEEWMDYLEKRNLLAPGSRKDVLANQLVLVAPADSTASVKITSGPALVQALGGARIATGDPDSVPVGKYAKAALIKLGCGRRSKRSWYARKTCVPHWPLSPGATRRSALSI